MNDSGLVTNDQKSFQVDSHKYIRQQSTCKDIMQLLWLNKVLKWNTRNNGKQWVCPELTRYAQSSAEYTKQWQATASDLHWTNQSIHNGKWTFSYIYCNRTVPWNKRNQSYTKKHSSINILMWFTTLKDHNTNEMLWNMTS